MARGAHGCAERVGDLFGVPAMVVMSLTHLFGLFLVVLGLGDLQAVLPGEYHYATPVEESAASVIDSDIPAGKAVAPLLGGLGTWSFKVTTKSVRAQQFFDQGIRMVVHVQPCRSRARVSGSGAARSGARHGAVGRSARARAEYQCPADRRRSHAGVRRDPESGQAARQRVRERAVADRSALAPIHRRHQSQPRAVRQGVRRCDEARGGEVSAGRRRQHAVCRGGDGHHAVELLGKGRLAASRYG